MVLSGKGSGMSALPKDYFEVSPPDMPRVVKYWQKEVTKDLRSHLVCKLVKAIFPPLGLVAMHDQRIKDLILYARKVEREIFEMANDREQYYLLLAKKIYKIHKELQEKKIKRLQNQRTAASNNNSSSSQRGGVDFDMSELPFQFRYEKEHYRNGYRYR